MRGFILAPLLLSSLVFAQFPEVIWERVGDGQDSHYGTHVFPLGDQNDDGFADWGVYSIGVEPPGQPSEVLMDIYFGGDPADTEPHFRFTRDPDSTLDPFAGFVCGDLNSDGYVDWRIRTRYVSNPDSVNVEIFYGGPAADQVADLTIIAPLSHLVLPANGNTGVDFDFNGDGFDDLLIYYQLPLDYSLVYYGGTAMDNTPDLVIHSDPHGTQSTLPRSFGDLNGDGYSDLIATNNQLPFPTTYIYLGSASPDTVADYVWPGFDASTNTITADMNGDGADDIIISRGSYLDVHFGGSILSPIPDMQLSFEGCNNTPTYLANAGDFNSDGFEDLVVIDDACALGWGKLAVYLGGRWMGSDPAFTIEGRTDPLNLIGICSAIGVGDINNDGIEDLAIGATNDNTDGRRGKVVILSGDTTFVVPVNDPAPFHASSFTLHPCYPNPFNTSTTISFDLDHPGMVRLKVFDITGREVSSLIEESMNAGTHAVTFDGSALASGIYFYSLQSGNQRQTNKMVLLK
jgi:hypothetical protein